MKTILLTALFALNLFAQTEGTAASSNHDITAGRTAAPATAPTTRPEAPAEPLVFVCEPRRWSPSESRLTMTLNPDGTGTYFSEFSDGTKFTSKVALWQKSQDGVNVLDDGKDLFTKYKYYQNGAILIPDDGSAFFRKAGTKNLPVDEKDLVGRAFVTGSPSGNEFQTRFGLDHTFRVIKTKTGEAWRTGTWSLDADGVPTLNEKTTPGEPYLGTPYKDLKVQLVNDGKFLLLVGQEVWKLKE
jgi:hypothetical protein